MIRAEGDQFGESCGHFPAAGRAGLGLHLRDLFDLRLLAEDGGREHVAGKVADPRAWYC
jgi:hypothetical protein